MDPKAEEFRKFVESEVLEIIKSLAEKGQTTDERIQQIAKITIDVIKPGMSLELLYRSAVSLDDQFSELSPLVYKIMKEYEQKYEKNAINEVSRLVKSGKYEDAESMVKKVLQFKIVN